MSVDDFMMMRGRVKNIVTLVVLALYLVASTGFALHHCTASDSNHLLLINVDKSCQEIHHHHHHSEEDNECCRTDFFHLTFDYNSSETQIEVVQPYEVKLVSSIFSESMEAVSSIDSFISTIEIDDSPPIILTNHKNLAKLSIWRL